MQSREDTGEVRWSCSRAESVDPVKIKEETMEGTDAPSNNLQENSYCFDSFTNCITILNGKDFTISHLKKYGFFTPILFKDKTSLGLKVPDDEFLIKNSLDITNTNFSNMFTCPDIVNTIDWVNCFWPNNLKENHQLDNVIRHTAYSNLQKFCVKSIKGDFVNFTINMGGTSKWYHIIDGTKIFWLVQPTDYNIALYQKWKLSSIFHKDEYFGNIVDNYDFVSLTAGDTFFIPSGYIYATYTSKDSLIIRGYFLHSFDIVKQMHIVKLEEKINVPKNLRYPFYAELLWYVLEGYVFCNLGESYLTEECTRNQIPVEHFTTLDINGMSAILNYLQDDIEKMLNYPKHIKDYVSLMNSAVVMLNKHNFYTLEYSDFDNLVLKNEEQICSTKLADNMEKKTIQSEWIQRPKRNRETRIKLPSTKSSRRRRKRCKQCDTCRLEDCGKCHHCIDMVKKGGKGLAKQSCIKRRCLRPMFPVNTICKICSLNGWGRSIKSKQKLDTPSNLMECSVCYEIVHPECQLKQDTYINMGIYNDDLPNSWICPECQDSGKDINSKPRHFPGRKQMLEENKDVHYESD